MSIVIPPRPLDKRLEEAHVFGNGPSRPKTVEGLTGDVFGVNLSDFALPLKASFVMDAVVINNIHNNRLELPFPIIIPYALKKLASRCPFPPTIFYELADGLYNGESAGHYAVVNVMLRYKTVHMHGFDSLYQDSITSDSHQKIPEGYACPTNYIKWRVLWHRILTSPLAHSTKVVPHPPK